MFSRIRGLGVGWWVGVEIVVQALGFVDQDIPEAREASEFHHHLRREVIGGTPIHWTGKYCSSFSLTSPSSFRGVTRASAARGGVEPDSTR